MSFDQWVAPISEPSEEEVIEYMDDEEYLAQLEVEEEVSIQEEFEVAEDFEFEITDFADIQMALDYFTEDWTRMDLDNPDELAQTEFTLNKYPDTGIGIMFSTADLTQDDVTMAVSIEDADHLLYTEPYFADGIQDGDGGFHWVRFYWLPDQFGDNRYGRSATLTVTLTKEGVETDYTFTATLREPDEEED